MQILDFLKQSNKAFHLLMLMALFVGGTTNVYGATGSQEDGIIATSLAEESYKLDPTLTTIYVRKLAHPSDLGAPLGTKENPFTSLADAEAAPDWDVLFVMPSPAHLGPLDGGIALLAGQKLLGLGPNPTIANKRSARALITNTDDTKFDGVAVVAAPDTQISGIHIDESENSAISLTSGNGITISNVLITGHNTGLNEFPPPNLPSAVFAIQLSVEDNGNVLIKDVIIQDGLGGGIAINSGGAGLVNILIDGAIVKDLDISDTGLVHVSSISISSSDAMVVDALVTNSVIDGVAGNATGPGSVGENGIIAAQILFSTLDFTAENNTIKNIQDRAFTLVHGATLSTGTYIVRNNTMENCGGGAIFAGTTTGESEFGANMGVTIEGNIVLDITLDALLLLNSQEDSSITSTIQNNLVENVAAGSALTLLNACEKTKFDVTVENNIFASYGTNGVNIVNFAFPGDPRFPCTVANIEEFRLSAGGNDFSVGGGAGLSILEVPGASHTTMEIDFGGGTLGSTGGNRFVGNPLDVLLDDFSSADPIHVDAKHNWWGASMVPATIIISAFGSVDTSPHLTVDPRPSN